MLMGELLVLRRQEQLNRRRSPSPLQQARDSEWVVVKSSCEKLKGATKDGMKHSGFFRTNPAKISDEPTRFCKSWFGRLEHSTVRQERKDGYANSWLDLIKQMKIKY